MNRHGCVRFCSLSPETSNLQPQPPSTECPLLSQARRQKQPLGVAAPGRMRACCCANHFALDEFWYSTSALKRICYPFPRRCFLRTNSNHFLLEKMQKRHKKKKRQNNFKCKRNKKLFQTPCTITKVPGKMPTQPSLLSPRQRECEKQA